MLEKMHMATPAREGLMDDFHGGQSPDLVAIREAGKAGQALLSCSLFCPYLPDSCLMGMVWASSSRCDPDRSL